MVEFLNFPFDLSAVYNFATSNTFDFWISIGINLILSTIVGGIILVIILEVFSHRFGESVNPENAFLFVLVVNIINIVGLMGLLLPYVAAIPFAELILPALVWIGLFKIFFSGLSIFHTIIIGIVFYAITIMAVPIMVAYLGNLIPAFG